MGGFTSGGGMSNSSAASAGTGEQNNQTGFTGGSINFGNDNSQLLIIGGIALLAFFLLKK